MKDVFSMGEQGFDERCIIIAPLYRGEEREWLTPRENDLLMCADAGWNAAVRHGLHPSLIVGDFDSMPEPDAPDAEVIRLPVHKDDTDMVACLQEGRKRGYRTFIMAGSLGGRFDHAISNLQCVCDCAARGEIAWMCDAQNRVTVLLPGAYRLPAMPGRKLSLLAFSSEVRGVNITGTEWPLMDATLTARWPLGCSNEFRADCAELSFNDGALLVAYCEDL